MKVVTTFLFLGLLTYLCLLTTPYGMELQQKKCFYFIPIFVFFTYQSWICKEGDKWCFTAYSALSVFFLICILVNFGIIIDPYLTLATFLGLNFVLMLITRK